jgi:hypothetical protein
MSDWIKKLDAFLDINERDILTHAGKISHEIAKQLAESEYHKFHIKRLEENKNTLSGFDKAAKQIASDKKQINPERSG